MRHAYELRKKRGFDHEQVGVWCKRFPYASRHSLSCAVCLVTEFEFIKRDKIECITSHGSTTFNLRLPFLGESWAWIIAQMSENRRYLSKELNVSAWQVR